MITLTLISITLVVLFTSAAIWKKKELPDSISSLVYVLPEKWKWAWTVWFWCVSCTTCIPLITALSPNFKFVGFLTFLSLAFCGAMPLFMQDKKKAHNALGIAAGVLSQVCVLTSIPYLLCTWLVFVAFIAFSYYKPDSKLAKMIDGKMVFVAESFCYINVLLCVLIN